MDIKQAVGILETHNRWRRDEGLEPMLKPRDIGIAIDIVIEHVKNNIVSYDVIQSDFLCDRECSGENKCDEQCYMCADMEKNSV